MAVSSKNLQNSLNNSGEHAHHWGGVVVVGGGTSVYELASERV